MPKININLLNTMIQKFNQEPTAIIQSTYKPIHHFNTSFENENIDHTVVHSFGEEWKKFNDFKDEEIAKIGDVYFDIITPEMVNKNSYCIDIGCGTGRWTKYLLDKIGFMEAIDPSDAIYTADALISNKPNVRFSKASSDNIPFADETFDFGMSIGVLHHIPDTQKAMTDCIKKIKTGGYFYTYLYYSLDNKGIVFKTIFQIINAIRNITSRLPMSIKKIVCDVLAVVFYMPLILLGRLFNVIGLISIAKKLPLSTYQTQSFFVVRNDSLDRFGTTLEQRFSKKEVIAMMEKAGLGNIVVSPNPPYWHAVGKKI